MHDIKVFGIGFHKTGTSSLSVALTYLGYKVMGYFGVDDPDIKYNVYKQAESYVNRYDAFQDNPWPIIYKEMDQKFPGNKFILTERPTEQWIISTVDHFSTSSSPLHKWIYGIGFPKGNEALWIKRYEDHNQEVREYFKDRPDDLLIMDFSRGEGWEKLCPFLNKKILKSKFPHFNKKVDIGKKPKDRTLLHRAYYKFRRKFGGLDA
ncbi:sulfotransferase family protein [Candidatus Neomarinimicrobiota bacterium]